jgi:DNA-dependent RNA polymerase auxiliary subunit epsilon
MANEKITNGLVVNEIQKGIPVFDTIDFESRKEFTSIDSPRYLASELQDTVDNIISQCPDVDWNEDHLSYQIVCAIRSVLCNYIIPNIENSSNIEKFDVEAYKLTGKAEQSHGDIAIVVSRLFHKGARPISGVGFYEAKASSLEKWSADYPAYSVQQLRRLVSHTPKLSYLLYDKEAQFSDSQEWPIFQESEDNVFKREKFHSRIVDANFLKQVRSLSNAAYLTSQSFGYHFVHKVLSGRELDYSRPPIETIRRWLCTTRRTSALVVSIAVREEDNELTYAQLQLPGFEQLLLPGSCGHDVHMLADAKQRRLQEPKSMP